MLFDHGYLPIFLHDRGGIIESIHFGAIAVVNVLGDLVASYGDPEAVTFLRSSAKPFQVMPLLENGGMEIFDLEPFEIAVMCSSHSGTDDHIRTIRALQMKIGVQEDDLLCGVHDPIDEATADAMQKRGEKLTQNRHNCSGLHTGLMAIEKILDKNLLNADRISYTDKSHPLQKIIQKTVAEMCRLQEEAVVTGTDGCSVPTFAVPLKNAALAYARICDPVHGEVFPEKRVFACQQITSAMISNPVLVAGKDRLDTRIMEIGDKRILSKGGAEGFKGIGLLPGAWFDGSPSLGIAIKIADGDSRGSVCSAVAIETLRQLNVLKDSELSQLKGFGPQLPLKNCRSIEVGMAKPCFELNIL